MDLTQRGDAMDILKYGFVVARAPSVEVVDWSAFDSDEMAAGLARLCGDVLSKMTGVKVGCDADRLRSGAIYLNLTDNPIGLNLYFEKSGSGVTAVGIVTGHKQRRTVEVKEASKSGYTDALVAAVKQIVDAVYDDWIDDAEKKKIKAIRSVERFS
jgi:hypothetical protein